MKITGKYKIKTYRQGELIRESNWIKNLIVANSDRGVSLIIERLSGTTTYDLEITSASIGTGTNTPADSDTGLQTSVLANILVASLSKTTKRLTLNFFISDSELTNGTYTEFGLFCGTRLFARSLITPSYTKSSGEDTTIEYIIDVDN
jgi:hypothetical protein